MQSLTVFQSRVIASGGAGKLEHFREALTEGGADAALAASLFHYKELEIKGSERILTREWSVCKIMSGLNGDWYEALKG